jgi:hypothetical protein
LSSVKRLIAHRSDACAEQAKVIYESCLSCCCGSGHDGRLRYAKVLGPGHAAHHAQGGPPAAKMGQQMTAGAFARSSHRRRFDALVAWRPLQFDALLDSRRSFISDRMSS